MNDGPGCARQGRLAFHVLQMCVLCAACSGSEDAPPRRDCTCGGLVNICLDKAHLGTKTGTATNNASGETTTAFVIVEDDGTFRLTGLSGMRVIGQITSTTLCGRVRGTITASAEPGSTLLDGSIRASGPLSGQSAFLGLDVEWFLGSGDSGNFSSMLNAGATAPAGQTDVAGQWISERDGVVMSNYDVDATGGVAGQDRNACEYRGLLATDGSNTLDVELVVSACGALDGSYAGKAVAESADREDPQSVGVGALSIHADRDGLIYTERWTRP